MYQPSFFQTQLSSCKRTSGRKSARAIDFKKAIDLLKDQESGSQSRTAKTPVSAALRLYLSGNAAGMVIRCAYRPTTGGKGLNGKSLLRSML